MYYLISKDYDKLISSHDLNQITANNSITLLDTELLAISEVKSHLTQLYKIEDEFKSFSEFDLLTEYSENDRVYVSSSSGNSYYFNISATPVTGIDVSDNSVWSTTDNRNPQLVTRLIDIILYHIHSRIVSKMIPQLRIDRYNSAVNFLNMAREGQITLDIPLKNEDTQQGYPVRWGTNSIGKRNNFF